MNMFSHSACCVFILLMISFAAQKIFSLMKSNLFIFSVVVLVQGEVSENNIAKRNVRDFTACVSLSGFYGFEPYI